MYIFDKRRSTFNLNTGLMNKNLLKAVRINCLNNINPIIIIGLKLLKIRVLQVFRVTQRFVDKVEYFQLFLTILYLYICIYAILIAYLRAVVESTIIGWGRDIKNVLRIFDNGLNTHYALNTRMTNRKMFVYKLIMLFLISVLFSKSCNHKIAFS